MDNDEIDILITGLSWHNTEEKELKKVIDMLADEISNIQIIKLIQPKGKEYWENASNVIKQIDTGRMLEVQVNLLEWLQDLNWPGALNILSIFEKIEHKMFEGSLCRSFELAEKDKDEIWIENLQELKKRNSKYFILKEFISNKYEDRIWDNGYLRIDLFDKEDIGEFICNIYLYIVDYNHIKLRFQGYTPFCKDNKLFELDEETDSCCFKIDFLKLGKLDELINIIRSHYDSSKNYAWVRRKLIYSINEFKTVCINYINKDFN